jgi:hypothetical protein
LRHKLIHDAEPTSAAEAAIENGNVTARLKPGLPEDCSVTAHIKPALPNHCADWHDATVFHSGIVIIGLSCEGGSCVTLQQFRDSLLGANPPVECGLALAGLWWDAKDDWTKAHESAQQDEGPAGAWVHAYLHRKEGDASNAKYWYERAGKAPARTSLEEEWNEIAAALLG